MICKHKITRLFLCAAACLLLQASCTKAPTGEASKKAKLQFLSEQNPPMSFLIRGKPSGMAVDIVYALAKQLNIKPDIKIQLWKKSYYTALHEPNVFLFPTTRTKKRENSFYWLGPIMDFRHYLYAKKQSKIKIRNLNDAKKYTIATVMDFSSEEFLIKNGFKNLYRCTSQLEAMKALMENKAQLAIISNISMEVLLYKLKLSVSDMIPTYKTDDSKLYIAISKGTPKSVVQEWQDALKIIKRNRTYYKIYRKWFMSTNFSLYE